MAKRFSDTERYNKHWYRVLPLRLKIFWDYLLANCDESGVWSPDYGLASFQIGDVVTSEDIQVYGDRVEMLPDGKVFVCGFVGFQYGELSEACKPHQKVIKVLKRHQINPVTLAFEGNPKGYPKGIHTLEEEEEDKEEEKEKEKGGVGENKTTPNIPQQVKDLIGIWGRTLARFKIQKDPALDEFEITRLLQRHGFQKTQLALLGAGFEDKSESFDPAKHVSIRRLHKPDLFEKFVNLGAIEAGKRSAPPPQVQATAALPDDGVAMSPEARDLLKGMGILRPKGAA